MKLKLKETPREWQKFTTVIGVLVTGLTLLGWRRGWISREVWLSVVACVGLVVGVCWVLPRPFRGFYRAGMTISFRVGQVMGFVLLTVFFFVILTPLGLFLRLTGKDLLSLKKSAHTASYWRKSRSSEQFERQF